jgi:hypothetical protein
MRIPATTANRHGGAPSEHAQGTVQDNHNTNIAQYYCGITNGLVLMEKIIEVRSLLYAGIWDKDGNSFYRSLAIRAKDRIPVADDDIDLLFGVGYGNKDEQDMVAELFRSQLGHEIQTLATYIRDRRRTREDWFKLLDRDQTLELLATEAHHKAELFKLVESKIRRIQQDSKKELDEAN